jgi:hypothetical protein
VVDTLRLKLSPTKSSEQVTIGQPFSQMFIKWSGVVNSVSIYKEAEASSLASSACSGRSPFSVVGA